jgi:glucose uptake protein GlcU
MKIIEFIDTLFDIFLWPVFFPWSLLKDTVMEAHDSKKTGSTKWGMVYGFFSPIFPLVGIILGLILAHIFENSLIPMWYSRTIRIDYVLGAFAFYMLNNDRTSYKLYAVFNFLTGMLWGIFVYLFIVLAAPAKG